MDTAIDLSDASKALDLANIRFQLMWDAVSMKNLVRTLIDLAVAWRIPSFFI
jgi:hypothetical protein